MARTHDEPEYGAAPTADEGWGDPVAGTPVLTGDASDAGADAVPRRRREKVKAQHGRGRTWLILLAAFVVQVAVVAGIGNYLVIEGTVDVRENTLLGAFATIPRVYAWKFVTRPDVGIDYTSTMYGLIAFVVVAALFAFALVRGPVSFWRALVGVWLAVLAGQLAAGMVTRGISDRVDYREVGGKVVGVAFQAGGTEVAAGVLTGLLAGIVAGVVAVVSRRPTELVIPAAAEDSVEPYVEPVAPPPWHGDDPAVPAVDSPTTSLPAQSRYEARPVSRDEPRDAPREDWQDAQVTTQFSAASAGRHADSEPPTSEPSASEPTVAERTVAEPPAAEPPEPPEPPEPIAEPRHDEHPTRTLPAQDFPRPPDDEDIGHHPDDD